MRRLESWVEGVGAGIGAIAVQEMSFLVIPIHCVKLALQFSFSLAFLAPSLFRRYCRCLSAQASHLVCCGIAGLGQFLHNPSSRAFCLLS